MPIKAENRKLYPLDWKEVSARIKERDGHKCKTCGVINGAVIYRTTDLRYWYDPDADTIFRYPSGDAVKDRMESERADTALKEVSTRIVLTVAHLDHNPQNNEDDNLAALCQACHLRHDLADNQRKSAATRIAKKDGGLFAFEEVGI